MAEDWMLLEHNPVTLKTTYIRVLEDGKIQCKETIPMWLAKEIIEDNKRKAKYFDEMGGWKKAKHGAVVAAVPHFMDAHLKSLSGFDPTKGGEYDKDKYNSFLDDADYRALRTGGGRLGKRVADAPALTKTLKQSLLTST